MDSLLSAPAFPAYAASVSVLVITLYGLAFHTAVSRAMRKVTLNAEDVTVAPGSAVVEFEHVAVQRIKRAHQNLLENAAPFFIVGLLYCLTSPTLAFAHGLFAVFVGVRVLHAVFQNEDGLMSVSYGTGPPCSGGAVKTTSINRAAPPHARARPLSTPASHVPRL